MLTAGGQSRQRVDIVLSDYIRLLHSFALADALAL